MVTKQQKRKQRAAKQVPPRPITVTDGQAHAIAMEVLRQPGMPAAPRSVIAVVARRLVMQPDDGYRLAQYLEDTCHWPPGGANLVLAQSLDRCQSLRREYVRIREMEWVKENAVKPKYRVRQRVRYLYPCTASTRVGKITGIEPALAQYLIQARDLPLGYRHVIHFEDVIGLAR